MNVYLFSAIFLLLFGYTGCEESFELDTRNCKDAYYNLLYRDSKNGLFTVPKKIVIDSDTFPLVLTTSEFMLLISQENEFKDSTNFINYLKSSKPIKLDGPKSKIAKRFIYKSRLIPADKSSYQDYDIINLRENFFVEGRNPRFFFQNTVLSDSSRLLLIEKLNENCYLTYLDDETGYLVTISHEEYQKHINDIGPLPREP